MAERELSGKDLLEQLYRGLDTVPAAVEAEMDAQELRELAPMPAAAPSAAPAAHAEVPASHAKLVRSPLLILCGVAVAGTIAAAALHRSETHIASSTPVVAAQPPSTPAPLQVANLAAPAPDVVLVNPFDATETFTFPPGTSDADAREQMATMLLKRAVDRKAHLRKSPKLAAERAGGYSARGS